MRWSEESVQELCKGKIIEQLPNDPGTKNSVSYPDTACQEKPNTSTKPRPTSKFRQSTPDMNKTEQRYAEHLWFRMIAGEVIHYRFGAIHLRLARHTFYKPDFIVVTPDEIQIHEVKGHQEDDARVKIKCAAYEYFFFRFLQVNISSDNEWVFEEIRP
mgnify:CR=1 FL=1